MSTDNERIHIEENYLLHEYGVELQNMASPPHDKYIFNLTEKRNKRFKLYLAALEGDWDTFQRLIYLNPEINRKTKLSEGGDTALHLAAGARRTSFVKKLLQFMQKEDLSIRNNAGNTAFFLAVASGTVEIAKAMMEKNEDLVKNRENSMMERNEDFVKNRRDSYILPLHQAALMGNKEMVEYLYEATGDKLLDDNDRFELVVNLIDHGLYGKFYYLYSG
ncbi:hypothetical protein Pint_12314 [Pistacia integerrima]|uniref:Uncharacterized protein n=1 Tax=Pistacia integerrima TaxID=434235 RepID=A0ACC0XGE5_9ROSI|nr:hypothetical protein Pint_12314 [Pistacia integerrima]